MYFTNKFKHAIYVIRVLHFNHPSCNRSPYIKKTWGVKIYFTNKFEYATHVTYVLHFNHPSCNSTLIKKHVIGSNLSLIAQKKGSRIKLKFIKNSTIIIHNKM